MNNFYQSGDLRKYFEVFSTLQKEISFCTDSLKYRIVHLDANKNIIAIAMQKNVEFESFQADKEISIKIIKGKILLKYNGNRKVIDSGHTYVLSSQDYYLIEAIEETCLLLTTII
jgi:hypothetical protein